MNANCSIKAPFFEIGPKSYLYGDEILELIIELIQPIDTYI